MPFERPSLPELIDQGATEIESRLPGVLVRIRRSLVGVLNRVLAGALSSLYAYAAYLFKQAWPDTCDVESLPLHGARWGVPRVAAAAADGPALAPGTNGVVIPAGTRYQRADGVLYATAADAVISGGSAVLQMVAVVPGQAGNAGSGLQLTLSSPIAGVISTATTTAALVNGADLEDPEAWRARILDRIRKPPQGGAAPDYTTWTKQVAGVTRVWVYPGEQGAGTVVVRFVRDNDASLIPDAGEVATVQAALDLVTPVTAMVYAVAPIGVVQNFTIRATPNTPAVRQAIQDELAAMVRRDAVPGGTLRISRVREAISIAAGEEDNAVTVPAGDVFYSTGQIPTMGAITWVA